MFTITAEAAEAIRSVISSASVPDSGGLRIVTSPVSSNGRGPEFAFELAAEPQEGDEVVEEEGAQVFLGPAAAKALDDKLLDVRTTPSGGDTFAIVEQG